MNNNSDQPHPVKGWKKILVLFGAILLTLLVAEGLSRLILRKSSQAYGPKIHDNSYFDHNGVFRIRANSHGWHRGFDKKPILVKINSQGFRGPELRASPGDRIIFTGDSVVFNAGVQQEKTFIVLLEDHFQRDGHNVEIINAGTSDLGIDQYLLQAKHNRFDKYKPDLVVIGLYLNDSRPPQGFLGEKHQDKLHRFLYHTPLRHLALTHYLRRGYIIFQLKRGKNFSKRFKWFARYNAQMWKDNLDEFRQTVREAQFDWGAAWNSSFEEKVYPALKEINEIYSRKGVKFAVVVFPVGAQVYTNLRDPFIDHPQRQLSTFAKEANMQFFDLLPDLKRHKNLWLFMDQCHLNRQGNRTVAKITYPFLKDLLEQSTEMSRP